MVYNSYKLLSFTVMLKNRVMYLKNTRGEICSTGKNGKRGAASRPYFQLQYK